MKTLTTLIAATAPVILCVSSPSTTAAVISWGAPTTVAADTDVSLNGTLVGAVDLGFSKVTPSVVNGVSFTPWETVFQLSSGVFSFGGFNGIRITAVDDPPFGNLSTEYKTIQRDSAFGLGTIPNSEILTFSGLTVGENYEFQWWNTDPRFAVTSTATAGNSVSLDSNPILLGGLGEFAIGTFTADATTQVVTFSQGSWVSAMQLRNTTSTASLPESGLTLGLLAVAFAGLVGLTWNDRRVATS